jgi:hypothetical protein
VKPRILHGCTMSLLLAAATITPPTAYGEIYEGQKMAYSVKVPGGWRVLGKEEMEDGLGQLSTFTPNLPKYDGWFVPKDTPALNLPRIMIAYQRTKMPTLEYLEKGVIKEEAKIKEAIRQVSGIKGFGIRYIKTDNNKCFVLFQMIATIPAEITGPVQTTTAVFPGKDGVVELGFSCRREEVDRYQPVVDDLLNSFQYQPGFGYRDDPLAAAPGQQQNLAQTRQEPVSQQEADFDPLVVVVVIVIAVALLAGLFYIIVTKVRKKVPS